MNYTININNWGRFFNVPCSVVDEHIKLASGNAIKILLYILCSNTNKVNSEEISKQLNIPVSEIDDSIAFWQQVEIISCDNITPPPSIETKPQILTSTSKPNEIPPLPKKLSAKVAVKYSPKDIEKIVDKSTDLKFLMDSVQTILKRPITYTEQGSLIKLHEYYDFSVGVILMLYDYCEQIGKTNTAYVETIAHSWFTNDITTHEDVEKEIIKLIDKNSYENKISALFGLTAKLTPNQKKFIESWINLGFDMNMIEFAYEKCVDSTNKLSFPYINRILNNWANSNYKTKEDVIANEKNKNKKTTEKDEHSYDLDEFYKLALNNTPTFKND